TDDETRASFEAYVAAHLHRYAVPASIQRSRIFSCPKCDSTLTSQQIERRRDLGFSWIECPVCETRFDLVDRPQARAMSLDTRVAIMDSTANQRRNREMAAIIIEGKRTTNQFDVFLCHHNTDKPAVKEIAEQLLERGIRPWLDEWEVPPGQSWQRAIEAQIESIPSAAIFLGSSEAAPWRDLELEAFLRQFAKRGVPLIPVILPTCRERPPKLPVFLEGMQWVDFRTSHPSPIDQLVWGVTRDRQYRLPLAI
ncbi:MAG TPA: toll/interleukin-1 receptor domain-containing protein, partial [Ktedonobacterales bacterium]